MSGREAINYAARARASLSLALVSFEHFYGVLRPGEGIRFSTHVDPSSAPSDTPSSPFKGHRDMWWSRRVLPPGPLRLLHDTIYHHSRANPARPIWSAPAALSSGPAGSHAGEDKDMCIMAMAWHAHPRWQLL